MTIISGGKRFFYYYYSFHSMMNIQRKQQFSCMKTGCQISRVLIKGNGSFDMWAHWIIASLLGINLLISQVCVYLCICVCACVWLQALLCQYNLCEKTRSSYKNSLHQFQRTGCFRLPRTSFAEGKHLLPALRKKRNFLATYVSS